MHCSPQLLLSSIVKVLIVGMVIAVICLIDPSYVTAYININYEIVIIYVFSALTLLYCVVSIIMYCIVSRKEGGVTTNHSIAEVIFALAQVIAWLVVLGVSASISQRTIIESGEFFGWIGALSGVIIGCFLLISGLFMLNVINEKILSKERQNRYSENGKSGYSESGKHGYTPGQSY